MFLIAELFIWAVASRKKVFFMGQSTGDHNVKNWQPPGLLRGEDLRRWTQATAEVFATQSLLGPRDAQTASRLAEQITTGAQAAMDQSPVLSDRECCEGCPGCCHSLISVSVPEVCALADWLRENKSADDLAAVRQRAGEIADQSQAMDRTEFAQAMLWCPLLDTDQSCCAYPARPICCRAWNSLSRDVCDECYFSDQVCESVQLDEHAYHVGQGARAGLASAAQAVGLDGNSYELCSALVVALDHPDAGERWSKGEDVFADCHLV